MSDRSSQFASGGGVLLAFVGSAMGNLAMSILGPAIALAVHAWNEYRSSRRQKAEASLVEHLKLENWQLRVELATLKGSQPKPTNHDS